MAEVSFWGGVGVIGSSKILIEQDGWRVLLDFGLDFQPGLGLFRGPVAPRMGHVLKDRLRVNGAPWLDHIYRPDAIQGLDLAGGSDGKTAIFITHGHIDHIGLTGWVDPQIPIYCSPETARLMDALHTSGLGVEGGTPHLIPLAAKEPITFGPFKITRYPVDHDVVGASGYGVETEDGVVAFTGDIRLHGRHPEKSLAFADAVRGCRALVIEGTTLSGGFRQAQSTEAQVDRRFDEVLAQTPGLVVMTMYPRNIERVEQFVALATKHGRTMVWPDRPAHFLRHYGLSGIYSKSELSIAEIAKAPQHYILQSDLSQVAELFDLPHGPGTVFVHSNGEPLGPFDPAWDVLQDWLGELKIPFWSVGTGGHASPDDLRLLVERVAPEILFPLHSMEPDRLLPPPGVKRWLPQRGGRRYELGANTGNS